MLYQLQTGRDHEQYMDNHQLMAKAGWRVHLSAHQTLAVVFTCTNVTVSQHLSVAGTQHLV